jgi:hypothetical protein
VEQKFCHDDVDGNHTWRSRRIPGCESLWKKICFFEVTRTCGSISQKPAKKEISVEEMFVSSRPFFADTETVNVSWYSNHRILGIMPDDVGKKT